MSNGPEIICLPVTFGEGHTDPKSKYNLFKNKIKSYLSKSQKYPTEEIEIQCKLFIQSNRLSRGNDLDNFLKPIIDAIDDIIITSEKQIAKIGIERIKIGDGEPEGITLVINPI